MKSAIITLVLLGIASSAAESAAQPGGGAATAETPDGDAARRFQRGVSFYREGSFDAALAEFSRAYELKPDYRVLYNIAEVQSELGDHVAAVASFRKYLRDGASGITKQRRAEVEDDIERLSRRIAKLEISGNIDGAELQVDGRTLGKLPMETISLNAGIRRIVVKKSEFKPAEKEITLTGGETSRLVLALEAESSRVAPPAARASSTPLTTTKSASLAPIHADSYDEPSKSRPNPGFWISLAATGVAAGATVAAGLMTRSAEGDYDNEVQRFPGSLSAINDARNAAKRDALITDICGGITIVGIGTTMYFALTGWKRRPIDSHVGKLDISTGPAGTGWQVRGRF